MPSTILPDRRVTNAEASAMTGYSPERLDKLERRGQYPRRGDNGCRSLHDLIAWAEQRGSIRRTCAAVTMA